MATKHTILPRQLLGKQIRRGKRHDLEHPIEYRTWAALRGRCNNPKNSNYYKYGARGIRVDSRWDNFESFLADMGKRPSNLYSIERVDNNGHYSPEN